MTTDSNSAPDSVPDSKRSRLRATVAAIEQELARLPPEVTNDNGATAAAGLRASVADLVGQLALGPEPQYRQCPTCKHTGMRVATVCGHCWTKLTPPVAASGVVG
jgi:hypothetical protein